METFISVDVETSGAIPGAYSLLAIGACVVGDTATSFYVEVQPINQAHDPDALKAIGATMEHFARVGQHPDSAVRQLQKWVKQVSQGTTPVFVGFNAPFDWSFVNWYCHTYLGENPFGIAGLDIKSYYAGLTGCDWEATRSSRIPSRFKGKTAHTHNALDDAIEQAEMFELMQTANHPLSEEST